MQDMTFDPAQGAWVARGETAQAALRHPQLLVRPRAEPVPAALLGRPAGEVFAQLVRMNDDAFHARHRPAVAAAAGQWRDEQVDAAAAAAVRDLWPRCDSNALLGAVPVQSVARLLGVQDLDPTVEAVRDFTRGIAPGAAAADLDRADRAAQRLMAQGEAEGLDSVAAANRIALMQQSLDATSGLFGLALMAWQQARFAPDRGHVLAVSRREPAIVHTRRFAAEECLLGGMRVAAGQCVIVMLAEAPFGAGPHKCPGERLAVGVVAAALACMHAQGWLHERDWTPAGWRPLPNARIPVFAH